MWLAEQTEAFRDAIRYVALDPSAPYAAAVHRVLPQTTVVVDHCGRRRTPGDEAVTAKP